jgi:pimeloyl-ACP methyl ester carboxylesterase
VLAGHSLGGILVQLLAFRRPDLVAGLVLVDPGHEEMESLLPLPLRWGWRIMRNVRPDELHDDPAVTLAALRGCAPPQGPFRRARRRPERCPRLPPPVLRALDAPAGWARRGGPAGTPCRRRRHRPSDPQGPARRRGRHDPCDSRPAAGQYRLTRQARRGLSGASAPRVQPHARRVPCRSSFTADDRSHRHEFTLARLPLTERIPDVP